MPDPDVPDNIRQLMVRANQLHQEAVEVERQVVKELKAIGRDDLAKYWQARVGREEMDHGCTS